MIVSFELTMPKVGSWNGKWSGEENKYFEIRSFSKKEIENSGSLLNLIVMPSKSFYYNFGDGWGANVKAEVINYPEAKKRRRISSGFCGYEWMIDSIIKNDKIIS